MKSMFNVSVNGLRAPVEFFKFSGGETQVKFENPSISKEQNRVEIHAYIRDGEFLPLALLVDAIRRTMTTVSIKLVLPYLPYARQDRVMNSGESLAVKVYTNLINSLNFDQVVVDDCHSDVGVALLNNVVNENYLPIHFKTEDFDALVAPDAGALKKTFKHAKSLGITEVIRADKTRDVTTGNITGTVVHGDVKGKRLLITDDICDHGDDLVELAAKLKLGGAKKISLYVTHGIFSKGKSTLEDVFNSVEAKYDWTEF